MSDNEDEQSGGDEPRKQSSGGEDSDVEEARADQQEQDEEESHSSSSSSSSEGESSDEDSDENEDSVAASASAVQTDEDGHVLSEYELQRLERIKRNQEKLKQLGLEGGNLLPKKKAPARKKRKSLVPDIAPRESLSRSRKRRISYAEKPINQALDKKDNTKPAPKERKKKAPRMDRVVYNEFKRMEKVSKQTLRTAEMQLRQAKVEHRHATRVYESYRKKESRRIDIEKRLEEAARERKWLGGMSRKEVLQYADRKTNEILRIRAVNERSAMAQRDMEQWNAQRKEAERKMQMIDALDRFPNALKEATNVLNMLLLERSPKDPPPPRPSSRKTRNSSGIVDDSATAAAPDSVASMPAKDPPPETLSVQTKVPNVEGPAEASVASATPSTDAAENAPSDKASTQADHVTNDKRTAEVENVPNEVTKPEAPVVESVPNAKPETQVPVTESSASSKHPPADTTDSKEQEKQKKPAAKRKEFSVRNVGGWISPEFSARVKRSWLECDRPSSTYVPQVGDTVPYYPAGHHEFLKAHPDVLGKKTRNRLRLPLQERARKEFAKKQKAATSNKEEETFNEEGSTPKEDVEENASHLAAAEAKGDDLAGQNAKKQKSAHSAQEGETTPESSWYNEKWLSSNGDYPVICRVDKTYAEFPPDPNAVFKHVEKEDSGGVKLVWAMPASKQQGVASGDGPFTAASKTTSSKKDPPCLYATNPHFGNNEVKVRVSVPIGKSDKKSRKKKAKAIKKVKKEKPIKKETKKKIKIVKKTKNKHKPPLCLVVQLHPLCPVLPAQQDQEANLGIPPKFSVVTFPSKVSPFIVPFSRAYRHSHSLSIGDSVKPQTGDWIGEMLELNSLGKEYASNSLEGVSFPELLSTLDIMGPEIFMRSLETVLASSKYKLPFLEIGAVADCIVSRLKDNGGIQTSAHKSNPEKLLCSLVDLIRNTLPLWKGVTVLHENKRKQSYSAWDLVQNNPPDDDCGAGRIHVLSSLLGSVNPDTGLVSSFDEPLRAKIECTIEDFIKETEDSSLFLAPVTDQVAPSYSCAVPLGMCFERILRRLKRDGRGGEEYTQCYYRSVDSLISDLNEIGYNCMLYNSPDSDVVAKAVQVVPSCRKLILQVASRHIREKEVREKADDERRRLIMLQCDSSDQRENQNDHVQHNRRKSAKKKKSVSPFATRLNRSWIQTFRPDDSWRQDVGESTWLSVSGDGEGHSDVTDASAAGSVSLTRSRTTPDHESDNSKKISSPFWVPQSGDAVLYSRSSHEKFIKSHYQSLTTEQCMLPKFRRSQSTEEELAMAEGEWDLATSKTRDTNDIKSRDGLDDWVVGKVLWIRASFPRDPASGKELNTFDEVSPILSVGISFDYSWMDKPIQTISWRPCLLGDAETKEIGTVDTRHPMIQGTQSSQTPLDLGDADAPRSPSCCNVCGLDEKTSFLRPAWVTIDRVTFAAETAGRCNEVALLPNAASSQCSHRPVGLPAKEIAAIDRCFNLLKTRCLGKIPADYIDPKFCMDNVKRGWYPMVKMNTRLPSFENLLQGETGKMGRRKKPAQTIQMRGERTSLEETQDLLSEYHFLPPWTSKSAKSTTADRSGHVGDDHASSPLPYHEKTAPNPNHCLELVQLRLRNGYYRQKAALIHDIQEAYVLSVLQALSLTTTARPRKSVSVLKVARALNLDACEVGNEMGRVPSSPSKLKKGRTSKKKQAKAATNEKKKETVAPSPSKPKAVSSSKRNSLNEEEMHCKQRIEQVRKLYATAVVCAMETDTVERIFGTAPHEPRSKQKTAASVSPVIQQDRGNMVVRRKIDQLLLALSRDPCYNRIPSLSSMEPFPAVKVKITISASRDKENRASNVPTVRLSNVENLKSDRGWAANEAHNGGDDEDPPPDMSKPIVFEPHHYIGDRALLRTFFGRPGRMEACARCQASRRTMIICRVRKGHSNADFDWVGCFRGTDGLASMIGQLARPPTRSVPGLADAPSQINGVTSKTCQADSSAAAVGAHLSSGTSQQSESVHESSAIVQQRIGKEGDSEESVSEVFPTPPVEQLTPSIILERAQLALDLANDTVAKATAAANSPPKLAEDFIRTNFPVDPIDGHYNYCIVCGLSGDILCCEGCPNVSHAGCANLATVPEGDWYCSKCVAGSSATKGRDREQSPNSVCDDANVSKNQDDESSTKDATEVKTSSEEATAQEGSNGIGFHMQTCVPSLVGGRPPVLSLGGILEELRSIRVGADRQVDDAKESPEAVPEATEPDDGEKKPQEIKVGARIKKTFEEHGEFEGVVTKLPTVDDPFYEVRYNDGDEEDMSEDECRRHLVPPEPKPEAPEARELNKKQKRGRGRPRKTPVSASPKSAKQEQQPKKRGRPHKGDAKGKESKRSKK